MWVLLVEYIKYIKKQTKVEWRILYITANNQNKYSYINLTLYTFTFILTISLFDIANKILHSSLQFFLNNEHSIHTSMHKSA